MTSCLLAMAASHGYAQTPRDLCRPVVVRQATLETHRRIVTAGAMVDPPGLVGPTGFDWNDTQLGVTKSLDGRHTLFFGADGSCHRNCNRPAERDGSFTRTIGTLDDPLGSAAPHEVVARGNFFSLPPDVDYVGGGPVLRVPAGAPGAGSILLVYHAERASYQPGYHYPDCNGAGFCNGQQHGSYAHLGLAKSTDEGAHWRDLGPIVEANQPYDANLDYDIGDGDLVTEPKDAGDATPYFYIYFPDRVVSAAYPGGRLTRMSVARVDRRALLAAAASDRALPGFTKYYNGAWGQPGLGGASSDLLASVPGFGEQPGHQGDMIVVRNAADARYAAIFSNGHTVGYSESADGLQWSVPARLQPNIDQANQVANYATPVGIGADPGEIGRQFDIFYNFQQYYGPYAGWASAQLRRMDIVCTGLAR